MKERTAAQITRHQKKIMIYRRNNIQDHYLSADAAALQGIRDYWIREFHNKLDTGHHDSFMWGNVLLCNAFLEQLSHSD